MKFPFCDFLCVWFKICFIFLSSHNFSSVFFCLILLFSVLLGTFVLNYWPMQKPQQKRTRLLFSLTWFFFGLFSFYVSDFQINQWRNLFFFCDCYVSNSKWMVVIQKPSTEVNNGAVLATDGVGVHRKMFVCMTTWVWAHARNSLFDLEQCMFAG